VSRIDPIDHLVSALKTPGAKTSDFDLNPGEEPFQPDKLKEAAVLVPVLKASTGLRVLLTKRSSALKHHPGQIAFPGGRCDAQDRDEVATALREAEEEIGLNSDLVQILGRLPAHRTVTGFNVTPIVGHVANSFRPVPNTDEVSEVFDVPYRLVTNPDCFSIQWRHWRGKPRYYFTVPYGPYYIWGATARILRGLAERVAQ